MDKAEAALDVAAGLLRGGGTVALPTETVYGLAANALDAAAVVRIFAAKERPGWDPLIVHVCDEAMLARVVAEVPEVARRLMEAFWPGPLTLLLRRSEAIPDAVTAGRPLVGVRMPAHPVALELIRRAGVPVAAPSANRFGHTSPTTAAHVLEDLEGRIDAVVDSGATECGVESTVVDATVSPMVVYRPGAVTLEQIAAVAGPVRMYEERGELRTRPRGALPSPGVGLRHYAPRATVVLVEGDGIAGRLTEALGGFSGEVVGLMLPDGLPDGDIARTGVAAVYKWGAWGRPAELAQRLFAGLRWLDGAGVTVIVCPVPPDAGIGRAIGDRLRKASSKAAVDD
jgi:L-threonylcarbamoyladenylate synthase